MRSTMIAVAGALVVGLAASAYAQQSIPAPTDPRQIAAGSFSGKVFGNIDFGGQFSDINGDAARYQRYRDMRDGPLMDDLLFNRRGETWTLNAVANKVGYRDQRYTGEYRLIGKVKARFDWNQIPLYISSDTRLLYSEEPNGVFRLPDALQAANQAGLTTIRNYTDQASQFDLRSQRDTGTFDFVYMANRDLDFKFNVTSAARTGAIPYGAPFGFSNLIELPVPIDQRTTDAKALLEFANQKGLVSVGWDASWFNNDIETLIWDNPLKITDSPSYSGAYSDGKGPAQARMALWPDSTMQYVHGTASVVTPLRGRLTGYVAIGDSKQNATLLPHTINSLIPVIPLERPTAEADIRNTLANVQYVVRPVTGLSFNARYRYMDMDNRTPHFDPGGRVRFDGVYDAADYPTPEPYSVKRQNFDIDGTMSALRYTSVKVGYSFAEADRTFRIWEKTQEDTFRVSVDTTGNQYVSMRALFEKGVRDGEGFDEHGILAEVGEQPGMRHYDIADRDRKRFTLIGSLNPSPIVGFTLSAGVGQDDYTDAEFGLQLYDSNQYSVGLDLVPTDRVALNLVYGWEDYTSTTGSRTAAPPSAAELVAGYDQRLDSRRNWFMDYDGKVNNFDASLELVEIAPKVDVRFGANWSDVTDTYIYRLPPDTIAGQVLPGIAPIAIPQQLPPVLNELLRGTFDLTYKISPKLHVGGSYWYENYKVDDFALGSQIISDIALPTVQPGATPVATNTLLLGYMYRPYTANTGMVRLTYFW